MTEQDPRTDTEREADEQADAHRQSEPGEVGDLSHGLPGDAEPREEVADAEGALTEINDDEPEGDGEE